METDRCQYSIANVKNSQTNAAQIQIVVIRFKIKASIAKNQTRESQVRERKRPIPITFYITRILKQPVFKFATPNNTPKSSKPIKLKMSTTRVQGMRTYIIICGYNQCSD